MHAGSMKRPCIDCLQRDNKRALAKVDDLKDKVDELYQDVGEYHQYNARLEKGLVELHNRNNLLIKERDEAVKENDVFVRENAMLRAQISDRDREIVQLNQENEDLRDHVFYLEKKEEFHKESAADYSDRLEKLKVKYNSLMMRLSDQDLRKECNDKDLTIANLKGQLHHKDLEIADLREQVRGLPALVLKTPRS